MNDDRRFLFSSKDRQTHNYNILKKYMKDIPYILICVLVLGVRSFEFYSFLGCYVKFYCLWNSGAKDILEIF